MSFKVIPSKDKTAETDPIVPIPITPLKKNNKSMMSPIKKLGTIAEGTQGANADTPAVYGSM